MKSPKVLIAVAVLVAVGGLLKMTVLFDADAFLASAMEEDWRRVEVGELKAEPEVTWDHLSVLGAKYHRGDGDCLLYGIDPAQVTEDDYQSVLTDLVDSGLDDKVNEYNSIWMADSSRATTGSCAR